MEGEVGMGTGAMGEAGFSAASLVVVSGLWIDTPGTEVGAVADLGIRLDFGPCDCTRGRTSCIRGGGSSSGSSTGCVSRIVGKVNF